MLLPQQVFTIFFSNWRIIFFSLFFPVRRVPEDRATTKNVYFENHYKNLHLKNVTLPFLTGIVLINFSFPFYCKSDTNSQQQSKSISPTNNAFHITLLHRPLHSTCSTCHRQQPDYSAIFLNKNRLFFI